MNWFEMSVYVKKQTKFQVKAYSIRANPGLIAIVKHGDHAMTWYDHGKIMS